MIYTNTKYWCFTWDTNKLQKRIPSSHDLMTFLNSFCSAFVFQKEKGAEKNKIHIQGCLTLEGPRMSKKALISKIQERFPNIHGLTLSPVHDKLAIHNYVTKTDGRVEGPFYGGTQEAYSTEMAKAKLRGWQQEVFDLIKGEKKSFLKDRKVIRIEDLAGNSGKSWFLKWLRTGQKELVCRLLPISSVDRLTSAVNLISKKEKVDVYVIDMTRTRGEKQSLKDIFSIIEQIKMGKWVM